MKRRKKGGKWKKKEIRVEKTTKSSPFHNSNISIIGGGGGKGGYSARFARRLDRTPTPHIPDSPPPNLISEYVPVSMYISLRISDFTIYFDLKFVYSFSEWEDAKSKVESWVEYVCQLEKTQKNVFWFISRTTNHLFFIKGKNDCITLEKK